MQEEFYERIQEQFKSNSCINLKNDSLKINEVFQRPMKKSLLKKNKEFFEECLEVFLQKKKLVVPRTILVLTKIAAVIVKL